jgi:arylsulfatase A-like enzyme
MIFKFSKHLCLTIAANFTWAAATLTATEMPNLVYILTDDQGYGDVSALNPESKIPTPNIDRLAHEGMIFTDAHSSSSVCTPTRYNVLTGRYAWRTTLKRGVLNGYGPPLIAEDRLTFASLLRAHGYQTAMIGKWHLGMELPVLPKEQGSKAKAIDWAQPIGRTPTSNGFDSFWGHGASLDFPPYVYIENDRYTSQMVSHKTKEDLGIDSTFRPGPIADNFDPFTTMDEFCDRSARYIRSWDGEQPFALYVPLTSPHTPILPSNEWKGKSGIGDYADFVMQTDAGVGRILQALDERGIADNTLVIFTSDNGCSKTADFSNLTQHGHKPGYIFRGSKSDIWEGGHRVPHLVRWPAQIEAGSTSDRLTVLGDIVATLADIVGAELPDTAAEDSRSFLPALLGEQDCLQRTRSNYQSLSEWHLCDPHQEWKLAFSAGSGGWSAPKDEAAIKQGLPKFQLYNMSDDPGETTNLYDSHPEVVQQLTLLAKEIVTQGRSTPGAPQANDTENNWKQLQWMH